MKKKCGKDPSLASSHWLRPDMDAPGCGLFSDNLILIVLRKPGSRLRTPVYLTKTSPKDLRCNKGFRPLHILNTQLTALFKIMNDGYYEISLTFVQWWK